MNVYSTGQLNIIIIVMFWVFSMQMGVETMIYKSGKRQETTRPLLSLQAPLGDSTVDKLVRSAGVSPRQCPGATVTMSLTGETVTMPVTGQTVSMSATGQT